MGKQTDFQETFSVNGEQHVASLHGLCVHAPQPKLWSIKHKGVRP